MMSKFSSHIKQESLRNIVLQESDCDTKLNQIRDLVGLPPMTSEEKESEQQEISEPVVDLKAESIKKILDGLEGKDLNLAKNLLVELEKAGLDWDTQSLELKVDGQTVAHSNLGLLIKKLVRASSPTLPIALVYFIDKIIKYKIPLSYIRDSDSQNIREALLKISERGQGGSIPEVTDNSDQGEKADIVEEVGPTGLGDQEAESFAEPQNKDLNLKRKREAESDTEDIFGGGVTADPKRRKVKKPFIGEKRRSSRLKKNLQEGWSELGK